MISKQHCVAGLLLLPAFFWSTSLAAQLPPDDAGAKLVQAASRQIANYHQHAEPGKHAIRVVYFHPGDRQPLADWRDRLARILDDVCDFYGAGLRRFGVGQSGLPFDRDSEGYVLHRVQGELPAARYNYDSGDLIEREIRRSLAGSLQLDREHVLVVHALCHQEKDGRYVFDAPYYGRGSQRNGLCHAADCELLDPRLLTATDRKIVYTEHYYPRKQQTVALFNTWYLGGLAHELGHGLGLPHDSGPPGERAFKGTTLMGSGNHHYREEVWGGDRPAYLSLGSALRLISHPLLTGSDRGRFTNPETKLDALSFSRHGRGVKLAAGVRGQIPAYAVIAYVWHPPVWPGNPTNDHGSVSYPGSVSENAFCLEIKDCPLGDSRLRLAVLHCNGAVSNFDFHLNLNRDGEPNVDELNAAWLVARAEAAVLGQDPSADDLVSDVAITNAPTAEAKVKLAVLRSLLHEPVLIDLTTTRQNSVPLSDAKWVSANVGWGDVARNHYDRQKRHRNSIYLELQGKVYAKGLYAHSRSSYVFDLNQRWKTFTATVGLRDGAAKMGSAVFVVRSDGKEIQRSSVLRVGQSEQLRIDVSGVERLELIADGAEGHIHNSWAIWAEPKLSR